MILTGNKIFEEVQAGNIVISPFNKEYISTNSYDLLLGSKFIRYTAEILDPKVENAYEEIHIRDNESITLKQGDFLLGSSIEKIGSIKYVPIIHGRSSIARLGLFVHVTADLIDIGSIGNTTFQLYATCPVVLRPGTKIAQVSFWNVDGEISLYIGKYIGSEGPVPSKSFIDYKS